MEKKVYIFNCDGTVDISNTFELYTTIRTMTSLNCTKYSLVFKDDTGKSRSRSGSVKNMETNFCRYLSGNSSPWEFSALELNDKPHDAHYLETHKRRFGFVIQKWREHKIDVYIVLPHSLSEDQMVSVWDILSTRYNVNYMVHYDFDAYKDVEICMYGTPMVRGLEDPKEYYSESEYKIVYKLHDLRVGKTRELEDIFPICITKSAYPVKESVYKYKKRIDKDTNLYVMGDKGDGSLVSQQENTGKNTGDGSLS